MAKLNEKTISEFVDSMMPAKEERNHEFTVNGTVASVDNNGVAVVYLDGGDANGTPCQATVGCSAGDRVIVSFKNREPVVTSNITSPTTSVAQLNAEVANINTVVAQKATITQLNTEVANINKVVAQKATITYVDTKTVNAVNVFATNGTFTGTLSAAKGTFTGTVTFDYNVAGGKEHISIGPNNRNEPIEISMTQASGESFKVGIYRSGVIIKHHQAYDNRDFTTTVSSGGISITGTNAGYCSVDLNGVSTDDGSRLISSSEISTLSNVAGWINRGAFTGNLNSTSITPGFYRVGAGNSYSGTKPSPAPSWCLFIQSPAYNTQIFIDASDKFIAFRDHTGNPAAWGSWKKITAS